MNTHISYNFLNVNRPESDNFKGQKEIYQTNSVALLESFQISLLLSITMTILICSQLANLLNCVGTKSKKKIMYIKLLSFN